jgi:hypothetical protein
MNAHAKPRRRGEWDGRDLLRDFAASREASDFSPTDHSFPFFPASWQLRVETGPAWQHRVVSRRVYPISHSRATPLFTHTDNGRCETKGMREFVREHGFRLTQVLVIEKKMPVAVIQVHPPLAPYSPSAR